jgi:putative transposase
LPVFDAKNQSQENYSFSGKRIKRGLYQTKDKFLLNADINGSANILRKVFPNVIGWDKGVVDTPVVVKVS